MLTFTLFRHGVSTPLVWDDGEIAGDEGLVGAIEAMEDAAVEVLVTPVGPLLAVDRSEPRTILAALEEDGEVLVVGDWPEPTWETEETEGIDLTF